ncbi:MAG: diaminopropionate ammonia-lyase [Clostridia bacterium]|nr:diaminopropionate ammonia-lyase [Clostridia bacterium]
MSSRIKAVHYERKDKEYPVSFKRFSISNAEKVMEFHRSFPEYSVTPLAELKSLSEMLGVKGIYVKDESYRFGLNAFKVLGGSYAIGRIIAERLNMDISELPYEIMTGREVKEKLGNLTFITATDGNHGRGVAWTANRLGMNSIVYMPKGTALERLENIRKLGSDASITDLSYDDAVRLALKESVEKGHIMVQDTAWDGYEAVPGWIMEGYTTMAYEAYRQLDGVKPTHIFLQAGVGSMAAAVAAFFSGIYGNERPVITIVEPNSADCIFRTAEADDGKIHAVTEDMNSIMAGLCCGEPCTIAWDILKNCADFFISMPDYAAANGMRVLGNPAGNDGKIVSGESGASTMGIVSEILRNSNLLWLKEELRIDENSRILLFSTEGDTDKENYRKIVWDGLYPGNI